MQRKLSRGVALLFVGLVLGMCLLVVNARPDGVTASSGEELLATLITIPMFAAWFGGLALIAWHFASD